MQQSIGRTTGQDGEAGPRNWVQRSTPARVEQILTLACDVLIRDGYVGFNLRKVAREVGVRLGSVQYHFPTREALLSAAIARVMQIWGRSFDVIADDERFSAEERLRRIQNANLKHLETPSTAPLVIEFFAAAEHERFVRDIVHTEYLRYRGRLAKLLQQVRPDLRTAELMAFASLMTAQMEGLALFVRKGDPTQEHHATVKLALDAQFSAFMGAFKAFAPADPLP